MYKVCLESLSFLSGFLTVCVFGSNSARARCTMKTKLQEWNQTVKPPAAPSKKVQVSSCCSNRNYKLRRSEKHKTTTNDSWLMLTFTSLRSSGRVKTDTSMRGGLCCLSGCQCFSDAKVHNHEHRGQWSLKRCVSALWAQLDEALSTSVDGTHPYLFKFLSQVISDTSTPFNLSLSTSANSADWSSTGIIPLKKKS